MFIGLRAIFVFVRTHFLMYHIRCIYVAWILHILSNKNWEDNFYILTSTTLSFHSISNGLNNNGMHHGIESNRMENTDVETDAVDRSESEYHMKRKYNSKLLKIHHDIANGVNSEHWTRTFWEYDRAQLASGTNAVNSLFFCRWNSFEVNIWFLWREFPMNHVHWIHILLSGERGTRHFIVTKYLTTSP